MKGYWIPELIPETASISRGGGGGGELFLKYLEGFLQTCEGTLGL